MIQFLFAGWLLSAHAQEQSLPPSPEAPAVEAAPAVPVAPVSEEVKKPAKKQPNITTSKIIKEAKEEEEFPLTPEGSFEYAKKVNQELALIKDLRPEDYIRDIDQYRSSVDKYVDHKKRVCQGEFSTVVLGVDGPNKVTKRNKLPPEERKSCFKEMKALQLALINNMYIARKRYLDHIHDLRLRELAEARDKVIKDLDEAFTR